MTNQATQQQARRTFMEELVSPVRYIVRYRLEEGRKLLRSEVLGDKPPKRFTAKIMGELYSWTEQATGDVQMMSASLVVDVVMERSDRYDDWHQVGVWEG